MTFSKQPPNRPGLWRWRFNSTVRDHPHDVVSDSKGKKLVIVLDGEVVTAESIGGEWAGPFVHADDVTRPATEEAVTPYDSMR